MEHGWKIFRPNLNPIREGEVLLWRTKRSLEDNINTEKKTGFEDMGLIDLVYRTVLSGVKLGGS
jgi:hypothetical protein